MLAYINIYLIHPPVLQDNTEKYIITTDYDAIVYLLENSTCGNRHHYYATAVYYNDDVTIQTLLISHLGSEYICLFKEILVAECNPLITDNMWYIARDYFELNLDNWHLFPHLAHYIDLPLLTAAYIAGHELTDRSLRWFLDGYIEEELRTIMSCKFTYVSKELLEELLVIVLRDLEYLGDTSINSFVTRCIVTGCSLKGYRRIMKFVDGERLKYDITN